MGDAGRARDKIVLCVVLAERDSSRCKNHAGTKGETQERLHRYGLLGAFRPRFVTLPLAWRNAGQQAGIQTAGGGVQARIPEAEYSAAHSRVVTHLSSLCDWADRSIYSIVLKFLAIFICWFYEQRDWIRICNKTDFINGM